jgi:hypothetical protein
MYNDPGLESNRRTPLPPCQFEQRALNGEGLSSGFSSPKTE